MQAKRDEKAGAAALARFRARHAMPPPARLPWGRVFAGVAAACALVLAAVGLRPARPAAPQLVVASPRDGARWTLKSRSGEPAAALTQGVTLSVEAGEAPVSLGALSLRLRSGGVLRVEEITDQLIWVTQESGAAVYEVVPGSKQRVAVGAGGGMVRVKGTRYRVAVEAGGASVAVGTGEVQVSLGEKSAAVGAGHQLAWKEGGALADPVAFNAIVDPDFAVSSEAQIGITR